MFCVDELELLKYYADVLDKGKQIHFYIFSKGGFTQGLREAAEKGEVRLVSLEEIIDSIIIFCRFLKFIKKYI